jgi:hypothetical protein
LNCRELSFASARRITNFGEESRNFFEKLLDIDSSFGADFLEEDIILF